MSSTTRLWQWLGQGLCYLAVMALLGYCSVAPPYQHLPADQATIKISLRHAGQIVGECTQRSAEQMANLPENMRVLTVCPRERSALLLVLQINGEEVLHEQLPARGLRRDGMASVYRRLSVPAGEVSVVVKMKDDINSPAFPYEAQRRLQLQPAQVLVIDFDARAQQFTFL